MQYEQGLQQMHLRCSCIEKTTATMLPDKTGVSSIDDWLCTIGGGLKSYARNLRSTCRVLLHARNLTGLTAPGCVQAVVRVPVITPNGVGFSFLF